MKNLHIPHAGRVFSIAYRRTYATSDDFATRMKAKIRDDVAKFSIPPHYEAVWQPSSVIVNLELPTALNRTALGCFQSPRN